MAAVSAQIAPCGIYVASCAIRASLGGANCGAAPSEVGVRVQRQVLKKSRWEFAAYFTNWRHSQLFSAVTATSSPELSLDKAFESAGANSRIDKYCFGKGWSLRGDWEWAECWLAGWKPPCSTAAAYSQASKGSSSRLYMELLVYWFWPGSRLCYVRKYLSCAVGRRTNRVLMVNLCLVKDDHFYFFIFICINHRLAGHRPDHSDPGGFLSFFFLFLQLIRILSKHKKKQGYWQKYEFLWWERTNQNTAAFAVLLWFLTFLHLEQNLLLQVFLGLKFVKTDWNHPFQCVWLVVLCACQASLQAVWE